MSYAEQRFGRRFQRMGDESEGVFEAVSPLGSWERYGWNREPSFKFMPRGIAATPDYYTNNGYLVEVMGCSGEFFNAMKVEKWEELKPWNKMADGQLVFFIWNTRRKQWVVVDYKGMRKLVNRARRNDEIGTWDVDQVSYYKLRWHDLLEISLDQGVHYGS